MGRGRAGLGLQVTVQHVCGVHELQGPHDLVHDQLSEVQPDLRPRGVKQVSLGGGGEKVLAWMGHYEACW